MLIFDDMRGVGVSKMTTSAIFENPLLFFLEFLVFQNVGHKQNMMTVFSPFLRLLFICVFQRIKNRRVNTSFDHVV